MTELTTVGCYGPAGASSRVRVFDWLSHLELDADVHSYLGTSSLRPSIVGRHPLGALKAEFDLRRLASSRIDRLLISREASPFSSGEIESRLLLNANHGVLDIDDGLMWDIRNWRDPAAIFPKPVKITRAARVADVVIAGNETLLDWARPLAHYAVYIPSCVEPSDYLLPSSYEIIGRPRIVWLGSPSTEPFLRMIEKALLRVNFMTGARLTVISGGQRSLGPLDAIVDREQWSLHTVARLLAAADVAIAPMPDTQFTRGKCAYKILQYGASGLPIITSPVGANSVAACYLGAKSASTSEEWVHTLLESIEAPAIDRALSGQQALSGVVQNYSFSAWSKEWKDALSIH